MQTCHECSVAKGPGTRNKGKLQQYNTGALSEMKSNEMKARFDGAANNDGFHEGDLVLLYNPQRKKGVSPKLQPQWDGPYQVVKRINDVVYRIQSSTRNRNKMKVVHLERLARYGVKESSFDRVDQI